MEDRKLIELLRGTISLIDSERKHAEEQLNAIHKIIGFAPSLLRIVMHCDAADAAVRQAGVIYLKNLISQSWQDPEEKPGELMSFSLHEQDRAMIRDTIIDAVVLAPLTIRVQLAVGVQVIVKYDFPERFPQIVDKITVYLQNPDFNGYSGGLLCLYQLVKNFEYRELNDRVEMHEAMNLLFPMVYQIMINLLNDPSEQSTLIQKQILKIYYTFTQYCLPLTIITQEIFTKWMEICRTVIERPLPDLSNADDDALQDLPWWKTKKWAMHILARMFERYGSPGNVSNIYLEFAKWYLETFTQGVLDALLKVLQLYRNKCFVPSKVLTDVLNYLRSAVSHSFSWKLLRPHIFVIIEDVIFPIMAFTENDQELWTNDPHEYIRIKFDVFDDYITPVPAAQSLFHTVSQKRKGILQKTMTFLIHVIATPNVDPKQKDGAFHMIGSLADVLLKKKLYRDQVEQMLTTYVFPEIASTHAHLRARACWVFHNFYETRFKNPDVIVEIMRLSTHLLLNDPELPVKVEAAIVIQMYITPHKCAAKYIEPQIEPITMALLNLIRATENEDLTTALQRILRRFPLQILSIAVSICEHLAITFQQVMISNGRGDECALTAMGILNAMSALLTAMDGQPQVILRLHPVISQVIGHVFQERVMEFYEESISLLFDLTSTQIVPEMWQMLELIYQVYKKDGYDYFIDMMPVLHNYVTVDTPVFLTNSNFLLAIYDICKSVLTCQHGEDPESHAAKLLEVIVLQCPPGTIDEHIEMFIECVLNRLTLEVKSSELRTMCLQVVIACVYYNPVLAMQAFDKLQSRIQPPQAEPISSHFIKQWILDTDCFLGIHDRKLYVLGLCKLLEMGDQKPMVLNELSDKILPSLMLIFDGLKRAYQTRALDEDEAESEEEDDDSEEELSSDEDDYDDTSLESLKEYAKKAAAREGIEMQAEIKDDDDENDYDDDDSDNLDESDLDETILETYTTPIDGEDCDNPIDPYLTFGQLFQNLPAQDPKYYALMTSKLDLDQTKALQELLVMAQQKKAHLQSKSIEKRGGFSFTQQDVPKSFNFGNS